MPAGPRAKDGRIVDVDSEPGSGIQQPPAALQLRSESWALWLGLGCTLVGILAGLIGFTNYRPDLAGYRSVGVFASSAAALAATAGSVLGYLRFLCRSQTWLLDFPRYRQVVNAAALVIIHAAISAMAHLDHLSHLPGRLPGPDGGQIRRKPDGRHHRRHRCLCRAALLGSDDRAKPVPAAGNIPGHRRVHQHAQRGEPVLVAFDVLGTGNPLLGDHVLLDLQPHPGHLRPGAQHPDSVHRAQRQPAGQGARRPRRGPGQAAAKVHPAAPGSGADVPAGPGTMRHRHRVGPVSASRRRSIRRSCASPPDSSWC